MSACNLCACYAPGELLGEGILPRHSRRTLTSGSEKDEKQGRIEGSAYHPETPHPHPKLGTSWPGLEQEEALEVCRKTGSDCRKWVPLFSPLPPPGLLSALPLRLVQWLSIPFVETWPVPNLVTLLALEAMAWLGITGAQLF